MNYNYILPSTHIDAVLKHLQKFRNQLHEG